MINVTQTMHVTTHKHMQHLDFDRESLDSLAMRIVLAIAFDKIERMYKLGKAKKLSYPLQLIL
jgi:hypothetical protein